MLKYCYQNYIGNVFYLRRYMAEKIKVFALGGLDEDGRDCYVIEIDNDIFVIDSGASLPDKTIPGVDSLLPNFDYLIKNKNRICAYLITHGHDESIGAIRHFYKYAPAPVYCTKTTMTIMEGQLAINDQKLQYDFRIVNPSDDFIVMGHRIRLFQTCHNAANSFGIALSTSQGNIIFTGDYIINFATEETNYQFDLAMASELAKEPTLLLMAESKGADRKGYCSPKHRCNDLIEKYFKLNKRIFVSCYWQNMYRLREVIRLIKKYGKKIYCYDNYTYIIMKQIIAATGTGAITEADFIKKEDFLRVRKSDLVILMVGQTDDVFKEIASLVAGNNVDKRIHIDSDDVFINLAIPRPSFETICTRSMDAVYRSGCEVVWLKNKELSAMHAREDDLRFILNLFKPKYYFPIRGHYTQIMQNAKLAVSLGIGLNHLNVFVLDNGMQLIFEENRRPVILPNEVTGIDVSPILVDGSGVTKISDTIIEARQKMGIDGTVVIASTVSLSQKKIIAGPDCQMRGFVFVKEAEPLLKSITQIYIEEVNAALTKGVDLELTKNTIKDRVRWFIRRENGREPLIEPIILSED